MNSMPDSTVSASKRGRSQLPEIPEGCGILPVAENRIAWGPRPELLDAAPEGYAPLESSAWESDPRSLPVVNDALEQRYRQVLARALGLAAAALLVACLSALSVTGAPSPGEFAFAAPLIFRIVFFSQILLLGLLSRYVERLGMLPAALLLFSYAAFCGMEFAVLISPFTLAVAFLCGALMYGGAALWGYLRGCDLARPITPVIMILGGGLALVVLNLALATPKLAWSLSSLVVVLFGMVAGAHGQQVRDFYQEFDDDNAQGWKASVLGALLLVLNSINLYLLATAVLGRFLEDRVEQREDSRRP